VVVATHEAANPEVKHDRMMTDGQVGDRSGVTAVDTPGFAPTTRAGRGPLAGCDSDADRRLIWLDAIFHGDHAQGRR
jgi:hypothetical protein